MKSYHRFCPVARALDVVGERWTILILRELFASGQARFSDIQRNLPDMASNLLAARLKDLEAHGVITKVDVPPPTPAKVYRLTESGEALRPVLLALGAWGMTYTEPEQDARFESHIVELFQEIPGSDGALPTA